MSRLNIISRKTAVRNMEQLKEGPVATMNSTIRQESVGELLNSIFRHTDGNTNLSMHVQEDKPRVNTLHGG